MAHNRWVTKHKNGVSSDRYSESWVEKNSKQYWLRGAQRISQVSQGMGVLWKKVKMYNLDVYCTCQDVYFEEDIEKDEGYFMAQCCSCDDWFHRKCLLIPDEIFLDEQKHESWHCVGCK